MPINRSSIISVTTLLESITTVKNTQYKVNDYDDYDCIQGWGWEACTPVQLHTIIHKQNYLHL